jgi:hypothetical protein
LTPKKYVPLKIVFTPRFVLNAEWSAVDCRSFEFRKFSPSRNESGKNQRREGIRQATLLYHRAACCLLYLHAEFDSETKLHAAFLAETKLHAALLCQLILMNVFIKQPNKISHARFNP